jgi:DNA-binding Lrp family transcriptional regulator
MPIDLSNPTVIAILAVVVLAIIIAIAAIVHKRSTTMRLRNRFGPEYERAVLEHGSERKAEAILAEREKRVSKLKLRELGEMQRERFAADWNTVQGRFIDHPKGALIEADELITALLQARGYSVAGFEQNADDISVNYPRVIESYRSAHSVAMLCTRDQASTEELRNAMIQYRNLFDELVRAEKPAVTHPLPTVPD